MSNTKAHIWLDWTVIVSFAAFGCACTSGLVNPQVPPPGTPAFQEGYLHGCTSGFSDAGRDGYQTSYVKNEKRYVSEDDYRNGWDKGHAACYEEERRHPRMLPGAI